MDTEKDLTPDTRNDSISEMESLHVDKLENDQPPSPRIPSLAPAGGISIQQLTDRALEFLSTASNETLGACLVGLGASTYIVLGRVGLVLIGMVGGVVLHATWESGPGSGADGASKTVEEKRRKETGLDVLHRVLSWRLQKSSDDEEPNTPVRVDGAALTEGDLNYSSFKPKTADALRQITDAVIRDYVKWWYSPILPGELTFPAASRNTLTSFILSISNNLSRKRPADTFLNFVTNTSSVVVVFFNELSTAINASSNTPPAEAVRAYVEMKPESNLAHVMNRNQQRKKLHVVAEDILQGYLESRTYNCSPAQVFLREILSTSVIDNTIESCSRAEWINEWIVYLLEEGEPELMKNVDAGLEGATGDVVENVKQELDHSERTSTKLPETETGETSDATHRRVVSRGQDAFDEAMRHVAELNKMIEEEDEKRAREQQAAAQLAVMDERPLDVEATPKPPPATTQVLEDDEEKPPTSTPSVTDDTSESTTQGVHTPTSSQSDHQMPHESESAGDLSTELQHTEVVDSASSNQPNAPSGFTSFDQIVSQTTPTAPVSQAKEPLTVYNANLSIFDDSVPGDRSAIKTKPIAEYLIQIEPASSQHSGWMIARKYSDFEALHEVIFRISKITGAGFDGIHPNVPLWKGHTKSQFRESLERYLNDAVRCQSLAESEGMKRFLEKDQNLTKSPEKAGLSFEAVGKDVMTGLTSAGKGVAGGGKAFMGGVAGVFGGIGGQKKSSISSTSQPSLNRANSASSLPRSRTESVTSTAKPRGSTDNLTRTISNRATEPVQATPTPIEQRPEFAPDVVHEPFPLPASPARSTAQSIPPSKPPSVRQSSEISVSAMGDELIALPPPPCEIDEYDNASEITASTSNTAERRQQQADSVISESTFATSVDGLSASPVEDKQTQPLARPAKKRKEYEPLSEQETTVAIELLFAVITELYTLSSAWSLRRTLLNAAKTFLLRPGNPQLESIRQLIQSTVLDANTSDAGIAAHLLKLRENSLPTEAEFALWPKELPAEEKEKLRTKARKLLVEKGMPVALTSVMGQAASGEALGKLFDCLQDREVARGLMFGLMLQGIRAVVQ